MAALPRRCITSHAAIVWPPLAELLPGWGLRCLSTWHWLKISDGGEPAGRLVSTSTACMPSRCPRPKPPAPSAAHTPAPASGNTLFSLLLCQDIEHRRPYESLLLCWPVHLPLPGPLQPDSAATLPDPGPAGQQAAAEAVTAAAGRAPSASKQPQQAEVRAAGFHLLPGRELVIAAVPPAEHSRKPHLGELLLPLLPPRARCLEVGTAARSVHSVRCQPRAGSTTVVQHLALYWQARCREPWY